MISKKTKYVAYIDGLSAVVNLLLNVLLIPKFKFWGALIAINASYGTMTFLNLAFSQRLYRIKFDFSKPGKILGLAASAFFLALALNFENMYASIFLKVIIVSVYLKSLMWTKVLDIDDIQMTKDYASGLVKGILGKRMRV
jgi:O-antigen/teichoic acid export membrane protein